MSNADSARMADALKGIEYHAKRMTEFIESVTQIIAEMGRRMQEFIDLATDEPPLADIHQDVKKIHALVEEINTRQREEDQEIQPDFPGMG